MNTAFESRPSIPSSYDDLQLLSSLIDIKTDFSSEVRTLTKRMTHIDEQISQIFNLLSTLHESVTNNRSELLSTTQSLSILSRTSPTSLSLSRNMTTTPLETHTTTLNTSPIAEEALFYSNIHAPLPLVDTNQPLTPMSNVHNDSVHSITNDRILKIPSTLAIDDENDDDSMLLSIPPPPSVYNRSASSSTVSLGLLTMSRGGISNKIVPISSSTSSKQAINAKLYPTSNTHYNADRSPKMKPHSCQNRPNTRCQQQSPQSTIIELESLTQTDAAHKTTPLYSTALPTTKLDSNALSRLMANNSKTEKTTMSSSTLLYLPTSDDEHPLSPVSSGDDDDDDHRPLTLSSKKSRHQTLL